MLKVALYFWESSTNSFQLPCGMVNPTLFDVVVITGLWTIGETFNPLIKNQTKPIFTFNHASFNAYIKDHYEETEEFSDYEHITFLTLWLSHYIFCSNSLQVAKKFISLATQIHEQQNVCLNRLVLGFLYESLRDASLALKARTNSDIIFRFLALCGSFSLA